MTYSARLLRVDLSTGATSVDEVDPEVLRKWIGGTGLGVYYLMQGSPAGRRVGSIRRTGCSSSPGRSANTRVSGTGTVSAVFKGPMNDLAGATQANGYLGRVPAQPGVPGIIIQGKADAADPPAHRRERRQAARTRTKYAGLGVWQLEDTIRAEEGLNEKQLSRVRDRAGRRALGAVLGVRGRPWARGLAQRHRRRARREEAEGDLLQARQDPPEHRGQRETERAGQAALPGRQGVRRRRYLQLGHRRRLLAARRAAAGCRSRTTRPASSRSTRRSAASTFAATSSGRPTRAGPARWAAAS